MTDTFCTIAREASDEFTVSRSRFIGYAAPCETEEDALRFLQRIREQHRDARHCCYAYIIGANEGIMRYSDDGEPGGTAGMPILEGMRRRHLVNCCVAVVRYFGGILLGTGGLTRAYAQACGIALAAAGIARKEWTIRDLCEVPYSCWDSVQHAMASLPAKLLSPEFGTAVSFQLLTRAADHTQVLERLTQVTGRQLETLPEAEGYELWEAPEEET